MQRIFASCVVFLCAIVSLQAQTRWFVTPGAPAAGPGTAWASPIDFQTAINNASAGDSVFVAQGTYLGSFVMKEGVKICGGFAGTEASLADRSLVAGHISILNGNGAGRVVVNNANGLTSAAVLDGFTVTGGSALYGAGMLNSNASPTVRNCVFRSNYGGGIHNSLSSATIVNCVFWQNIAGTTTSAQGGGITNLSSPGVSIIGCMFTGNHGRFGGGIYMDDVATVSASITNCTFWANTGDNTGVGGIYCDSRSNPSIRNSILWGDGSTELYFGSATNSIISNCIIMSGVWPGNLKGDPKFVDGSRSEGTDNIFGTPDDGLELQSGSLGLNGGNADTSGLNLPATDLAGAPRIQGGKIDIGAYENSFSCGAVAKLYVDSSVAASGDGSNWAAAYKTLDEALVAAGQCSVVDTILVAKGTYLPVYGKNLVMPAHVGIYGGFPSGGGAFAQRNAGANVTTLQGAGSNVIYNAYNNLDATAVLDGFTISGGSAAFGGGIHNNNSSPVINNCIISGNTATNAGGGIYNKAGASPIITNCIFSGNTTTRATSGGGAIYNSNGSPLISNCIFHDNVAAGGWGGAFYNALNAASPAASPVIKNCVFANNSCGLDGGAIASYGTSLTLSNVTIANNTSGRGGGAIDNDKSSLTITNTVIWGNTDVNGYNDIWWESGSGGLTYCFSQASWTGTGNITGSSSPFVNAATPAGVDGIWGTADDGLALQSGSPGIDAGTPDPTSLALGNADIARNLRIAGAAIDMGAYESNSTPLPITILSFTGILESGIAHLQWRTGVESNFNHFEVEKSVDGSVFKTQGEIAAKGSSSSYSYHLAQQEPVAYYRLKVVDNDGGYIYSRTLILSQRTGNNVLAYPNPATNFINIKVDDTGNFCIYSADGKLVKVVVLSKGVNAIDISELSGGMYYGVMKGRTMEFVKK